MPQKTSILTINRYTDRVLDGKAIERGEARELFSTDGDDVYHLFLSAYAIRKKFRGKRVELCAIANARSGACSEDCAFCAQSSWHKTEIPAYPLLAVQEVYRRAKRAQEIGAGYFCIVTSGRCIEDSKDFQKICQMISRIRSDLEISVDASLGELTVDQAKALKSAGLRRYNHNLEAARSLFPKICTTHTYTDRLRTIENVKAAGLELCCGGIIGMGESVDQRLEFLFDLKELEPHCIPVNFLTPVPGTRLEKQKPLVPLALLKTVAICRFLFPKQEIKICGGREANLGSLQPLLFLAGADSIIIGDYLTTKGNPAQTDLQMIRDLGLVYS